MILRESTLMTQDADRLVWIDLEMTGLKPDTDRIIEVALVVTDAEPRAGRRGAGLGRCIRTTRRSPRWTRGTRGRTAAPA